MESVPPDSGWVKSSASMPNGDCIEIAVSESTVWVRDSKDRGGATIAVNEIGWRALISAIKQGKFS